MSPDELTQWTLMVVSRHYAIGCLLTIVVWSALPLLLDREARRHLRDGITYFVIIGCLAAVLAFRPQHLTVDFTLWEPITWFCFTMLLIFELFWTAYLIEAIFHFIGEAIIRKSHNIDPEAHRRLQRPPPM